MTCSACIHMIARGAFILITMAVINWRRGHRDAGRGHDTDAVHLAGCRVHYGPLSDHVM